MPWTKVANVSGEMNKSVSKELRKMALRVLRGVVVRAPVDTGRLRGAWIISVNFISRSPGAPSKETPPPIAKGMEGLKKVKKLDDVIYVVNNMPYAKAIEDGHGGRSPGVMVKATLASLK